MQKKQYIYKFKLFKMYIVCDESYIYGIHWKKQAQLVLGRDSDNKLLKKCIKQLDSYFLRQLKEFNLPLKLEGTDFQKIVWEKLQTIPYGETISYKELAIKVGNPNASRAVGSANGKNPVSILIPCHRVISSSGQLGGYAGGEAYKEALLTIEAF